MAFNDAWFNNCSYKDKERQEMVNCREKRWRIVNYTPLRTLAGSFPHDERGL